MTNFFLIAQLQTMWHYDFMRNAFEAGTIVAIVAGIVGYFVVIGPLIFRSHALSHAGFTGAAGAVLIGINPIGGTAPHLRWPELFSWPLWEEIQSCDVQNGPRFLLCSASDSFSFSLYKGYATAAYSILFGEILGISRSDVMITFIAGIIILISLAILYRPLPSRSLDEDVAEAKGLPVFAIGIIFMLIIAVATSIAVQIVGVLLIFTLMVTPAAIAERIAKTPMQGISISVAIALFATWVGLILAFYLPYPVSFFITTIVFALYGITRFFK